MLGCPNCPDIVNENQLNTDKDLFDAGNVDVVSDADGDECDEGLFRHDLSSEHY